MSDCLGAMTVESVLPAQLALVRTDAAGRGAYQSYSGSFILSTVDLRKKTGSPVARPKGQLERSVCELV